MDADVPPPRPADEPAAGDPGSAAGAPPRQRVRVGRFKFFVPKPQPEDVAAEPPATTAAPAFDAVLAAAVLLLAAVLASFAATNADLWPHLAAGKLVAAGRFPFGADPFSAVGAAWINHAWLLDLISYGLYQVNDAALVAAKAGVIVALAAVLLGLRRPGGGGLGPAAATVLVLLAASPGFVLRSAVASYLLFAFLLLILNRPRAADRWRLPLAVGILFLFWVNLDGGFVFGLLLLAVWTAGSALERWVPMGDRADGHAPGVLAVSLAVALVASLINPYHVHAFGLPAELAVLRLPDALRADPLIRSWFGVSPLESGGPDAPSYLDYAGAVSATALYLLFAAGVASFAVNAGGWRWSRVLAWAAFAWLGSRYGRLVPYFAVVCGPVTVLNVQAALARRQAAGAASVNRRLAHLRAALANLARTALLLTLVVLAALAWPGWLGRDPRAAAPSRRVAWRVVADPTYERLANRLAELRGENDRGFHLQPDFSAYCAWFCPAERGLVDARLTAPPDVIADYLALQAQVRAINSPPSPDSPGPPEPLLQKYGITHVVVAGRDALHDSPELDGLAVALFFDPARWPLWVIEGRGVVCGWRAPRPDPTAAAFLPDERTDPAGPDDRDPAAPPEPPSIWDRYRSAPAPTTPDAYEAGLWLAYHEAIHIRELALAVPVWQEMTRLSRMGTPVVGTMLFDASNPIDAAWRRSPEGRRGQAAALLAVRAARRATRANPDDPDAYVRLTQAYAYLDTDPTLSLIQRIASARLGLARLAAAPHRSAGGREELFLQDQLYNLYSTGLAVPGSQRPPVDLIQEALARVVELRRTLPNPPADPQFERQQKKMEQDLARLNDTVGKRRDEVENATHNQPVRRRAEMACAYGLAREALTTLRDAAPGELDRGSVVLLARLLLLAGEADNAWDLVRSPALAPENFNANDRQQLDSLAAEVAAAVGADQAAADRCDAVLEANHRQSGLQASVLLGSLVFTAAGPSPLAPGLALPTWGGLWRQNQVPVVNNFPLVGTMTIFLQVRAQSTEWLAREGMLALEAGNVALARRRLTEAAVGIGPGRDLARHWLAAWNTSNR